MTSPTLEAAPVAPPRAGGDLREVDHLTADRIATGVATAVPAAMVGVAAWLAWDHSLHLTDVLIFAGMYCATGLGITVGFHRLLTHRAFRTRPWLRGLLAALGSMAIEGPVIEWVANHRKHHAFSDQEGDPHSPHVGHGSGWRAAVRGLAHAHLGWVFGPECASEERYAADLRADPVIRFVDATFVLWVLLGLAIPFGLGVALTGSVTGGLTALLWGGAVRIFVLHHVTFGINSLCHFFGRRRFAVDDESRNLWWLALLSFGEAWHHNHHAFPTSARHGLRPWELDPAAWVIRALEAVGLASEVVRIPAERQERKAVA